jgi:hydrogenase/urease accessory protein HupE
MTRSNAVPGTLLFLAALLRATSVQAHAVGMSRGEYHIEGTQVEASLVFSRKEMMGAFPGLDSDRDGELTTLEITRARDEFSGWIRRGLVIRNSAQACDGVLETVALTEQDGLAFTATYQCPSPAGVITVALALFDDLSSGHRHLAAATSGSQAVRAVLYQAQPEFEAGTPGAALDQASGMGTSLFRLGLEHILTGYDHLLFLLALVLVAGPLRSLLAAVTAFTLAHSITLAVAALGIWTPRPLVVEPAIALSIAFVGIENCFVSDLRGRWRLTFAFGLVHGFGFAGALREIALPSAQLPFALASFNVGVEAGQLAVLSLVLPSVWWLRRQAWFVRGVFQTSSIAIAAMGLWWFVARVAGG